MARRTPRRPQTPRRAPWVLNHAVVHAKLSGASPSDLAVYLGLTPQAIQQQLLGRPVSLWSWRRLVAAPLFGDLTTTDLFTTGPVRSDPLPFLWDAAWGSPPPYRFPAPGTFPLLGRPRGRPRLPCPLEATPLLGSMTLAGLSHRFAVSTSTVARWRREAGVVVPRGRPRGQVLSVPYVVRLEARHPGLREALLADEVASSVLGQRFGLTRERVRQIRVLLGLSLSSQTARLRLELAARECAGCGHGASEHASGAYCCQHRGARRCVCLGYLPLTPVKPAGTVALA